MSGFSIKRPSIKITDIKRLCRKAKEKNDLRSKVALWRGDITRLEIDAIVNAANRTLLGGGGVDGAIHAAAGRKLLQECETLNGCETGEAKITKGYKLPSKHVIHTVGPIGENEEMLKSCYENSLNIVLEKKLKSVAFPCISTGIYGYPNKEAAHVVLGTVKEWLMKNHENVDLIIFCLFLETDVRIYNKLADEYFPQSGDDSNSSSVKDSSTSAEEAMSVDSDNNTSPVEITEGDAVESKSVQLPEEVSMKDDNISTDNPELSQKSDGISNDERTGEAEKQSHEESKSMTDDATEPEPMQTKEEVSMQSNEETDLKSASVKAPSSTTEQCSIHDEVESKIEQKSDGAAKSKHPEETSEKSCDEQDSDSDKEIQDKPGLSEKEREEWIEKFGRSTSEAICKVIKEDTEKWAFDDLSSLKLIGGLDVSYHKTRSDVSCVSLVVLSYPDLNVVYEDSTIESVTVPYISGYLAYREAEFYQEKIEAVKKTNYSPQVILVDGNGTLHPRKFGSATHVGVHSNIPTIGVAKNLIVIEEFGIHRDEHHRTQVAGLEKRGSGFDVVTSTEEVLGKAVRTSQEGWKPVYVSIGHRCSLDTAVRVTLACCKHRVPEPIRQADQISKSKLRKEFKNDYDSYYAKKQ